MRFPTGRQAVRGLLVTLSLLIFPLASAHAEISFGIQIGINVPVFPRLVLVPGYPVYYAPQMNSNYFFYDGLYWVYQDDNWFVSSWYNGPWDWVEPEFVPLFVLRIPVRYYRHPPPYFRGWRGDSPPRWGERWGRDWEDHRPGWDRWNRREIPRPAPVPVYQRQYSGTRYPDAREQQHSIRSGNYRYQPREDVTQQYFQPPGRPRAEPQQHTPVQTNQPGRAPQVVQPQARPFTPAEQQERGRSNPAIPQDLNRESKPRTPPVPAQPYRQIPPTDQPAPAQTNQPGRSPQPAQPSARPFTPAEQQDRGGRSVVVPQDVHRETGPRALPGQQPSYRQATPADQQDGDRETRQRTPATQQHRQQLPTEQPYRGRGGRDDERDQERH